MRPMERRARLIKKNGGIFMMMDVITTGFTAVDTMRRRNLGLAIHAHRAMHGFITRDNSLGVHGHGLLEGFSISMVVLAKLFRLLGVDSIHGGSPLSKMEEEVLPMKSLDTTCTPLQPFERNPQKATPLPKPLKR